MDDQSLDDGKKNLLVAAGINESINLDSEYTPGKSTQDNTLGLLNDSNDNSMQSDQLTKIQQAPGSFESTSSNLLAHVDSRNDSGVSYDAGAHSKNSLLKRQKALEHQKKIKSHTDQCIKFIEKNNSKQLIAFLSKIDTEIKINELVDGDGFTLLHMAVFKNKQKSFDQLLKKAKDDISPQDVTEWINLKTTKDQFTALHYAAFRGNIHFCDNLIENGADKQAKNAYGLNVLHISAQGDQPISLYYFKYLGMNLTDTDSRGSTPLHWACFQNSEVALIYLLGWVTQKDLALQDIDGYTPLHLSVKSSESLKSGRPLRALLMKGAPREARDKRGNKAIDLINDIKSESLKNELKVALEEESSCDCLMLKTQLKKTEKSMQMPIVFLVIFDLIFLILIFFIFPVWESVIPIYVTLILGVMTMIFWALSQYTQPGYIRKPKHLDFLKLMELVDPIQLCPDCLVIRTPRSRHCNTCNACVERFDHHCPWINNCVGINNHLYFLSFLFFLISTIISIFISTLIGYMDEQAIGTIDEAKLFYELLPESVGKIDENIYKIASMLIIVVTGFFLLPVFFLFNIQLKNFRTNRTTNERFSRRKPYGKKTSKEVADPRADSTGSSLLSTTIQVQSDDIIREFGEPTDYSQNTCSCFQNQKDMCCIKKFPEQQKIFEALCENKQGVGRKSSIMLMNSKKDVHIVKSPINKQQTSAGSGSTQPLNEIDEENTMTKSLTQI